MRTRDSILAGASAVDPGSQTSHLTVLEVLLDIRDELVAQGKPTEVIAEAPVHLEPSQAGTVTACDDKSGRSPVLTWDVSKITCMPCLRALLANGSLAHGPCLKREEDLRAQIRKDGEPFARVGKLVGVDTSTVFVIEDVVQRVAELATRSGEAATLTRTLSTYLGSGLTVAEIVAAVRNLGSLAQDRKDEIDRLAACANVCGELLKLLKVPDHTHLAEAVRDRILLAEERKKEIDRLQAALNDARPRP